MSDSLRDRAELEAAEAAKEAHFEMWPDGCDANCSACQRRLANRCDDGHQWHAEWSSGDSCYCGQAYLTKLPSGELKVTP